MSVPDRSINDRLAELYPMFHWYSRRFVGLAGAEEDDLVQEAAVAVWQAFEKHNYALDTHVQTVAENAMKNWIRTLSRQGYDDPNYLQPE